MNIICLVPVSPLRASPSHRSEMVSQLLFGEIAEVLDKDEDFTKLKMLNDRYEGWCQTAQIHPFELNQSPAMLAGQWSNSIFINGEKAVVPFGSSLSFMNNSSVANVAGYEIMYNGSLINPSFNAFNKENLKQTVLKYLNTPYLWGGRSVFGIDCSGFVQQVYQCFNVQLQRDAYQQATEGEAIGFLQESKIGDLAFFDNADGNIIHVGILLNENKIIHASGKVRIDSIDNMGIINKDTGRRTHNLRVIKRVVEIGL